MEFGAFVEFLPGKERTGAYLRARKSRSVAKVEDVLKLGDKIKVKLIGFDRGEVKLSRKALL
ncbi:MAG: hypothetical protein MZV70_77245 [Desulfobacterales bacterium]|nr:hypothetical protein [Desulfobacterales bacterium]